MHNFGLQTYIEALLFQVLLAAEDEEVGKVGRLHKGNVAGIFWYDFVRAALDW